VRHCDVSIVCCDVRCCAIAPNKRYGCCESRREAHSDLEPTEEQVYNISARLQEIYNTILHSTWQQSTASCVLSSSALSPANEPDVNGIRNHACLARTSKLQQQDLCRGKENKIPAILCTAKLLHASERTLYEYVVPVQQGNQQVHPTCYERGPC